MMKVDIMLWGMMMMMMMMKVIATMVGMGQGHCGDKVSSVFFAVVIERGSHKVNSHELS